MTKSKGHSKRGGRRGNRNTTKGPRVGRPDKPVTRNVAALPQPRADAKLPRRPRREKTGGRDFAKGQNSHDGDVFRRTEDQLPRGNFTLYVSDRLLTLPGPHAIVGGPEPRPARGEYQ